ncbi:class I SAM-dependent methyltransferase [Aliarcobacter butzleri]|uniref:class I SAM-dependent methyltransferase n=1 Tax=Aliarcobacter butzleri TaxID=28197 RepID=UPI00263D4317|nr:class I SAM-dependent methyltransferase [Aliarcobacter butzleri]MDN5111036.1 class I SAM-dependent methyltransferase [Aliarcobacter butzleri]
MVKTRIYMIDTTIDYYNNNANKLVKDYDKADMSNVYILIEKFLKSNDKILDIGFGSGRDIRYFNSKNFEIYGIDASKKFVEIFKKSYPNLSKFVYYSVLPEINIPIKNFDLIFSMATWMHLTQVTQENTIINIKNHLKDNGIFVVGYSYSKRENDPRLFEDLNPRKMELLFSKNGFSLIEKYFTNDSLKRENLKWVVQVFKLK